MLAVTERKVRLTGLATAITENDKLMKMLIDLWSEASVIGYVMPTSLSQISTISKYFLIPLRVRDSGVLLHVQELSKSNKLFQSLAHSRVVNEQALTVIVE